MAVGAMVAACGGAVPRSARSPGRGGRFAPPQSLGVRIAAWSAKRAEGVVRTKAWGGATSPLPQPGVSLPHLVVPLGREGEAPTGMSLTSPRGDAESGLRGPRRSPRRAPLSALSTSVLAQGLGWVEGEKSFASSIP